MSKARESMSTIDIYPEFFEDINKHAKRNRKPKTKNASIKSKIQSKLSDYSEYSSNKKVSAKTKRLPYNGNKFSKKSALTEIAE
jgi:hypothetical protein